MTTTCVTSRASAPLVMEDPVFSCAYLRRQHAFILAQVFHPEQAAQAAAQVLIPAADVPWQPGDRRYTGDWITVLSLVEWCDHQVHDSLIYEVYVEQLLGMFQRRTATWPSVRREALRVYGMQAFGVDCTDPVQMAAVASAACEAKREAAQVLYGEEEQDEEDDGEHAYYRASLDAEYSARLLRALTNVTAEDQRAFAAAIQACEDDAAGPSLAALQHLTAVAEAILHKEEDGVARW